MPAPEVVPADDDEHERDDVGRVSGQLKRQLRHEGADAPREIHRSAVQPGTEEPGGIRRLVTRK